ncbi:MAG: YhbY family RNA-binding protein [Gemmatimonadaceae bacterium]|nr:YhbY family RNA-binding protein [Gemmatimonadaceae bacterium]
MPLTSKERAALRAEAHHLTALLHVGHHGAHETMIGALDDALRTHELVKIQLNKSAEESARDTASRVAAELRAEVVQIIGRTATLYRANPDLERRKGDSPPWRK